MDVVIPLGKGSLHNDIELHYAVKSLKKYGKGIDNIWIVGDRPRCEPFEHSFLPYNESRVYNQRAYNIYNKIKAFCLALQCERFVFMNDDHFLLQPIDFEKLPYYHKGPMKAGSAGTIYDVLLSNTLNIYPGTNDFDTHTPIVYERKEFLSMPYPEDIFCGFGIKTMYCNHMKIKGEYLEDAKIRTAMKEDEIRLMISNKPFFSIGDEAFSGDILQVLSALYD